MPAQVEKKELLAALRKEGARKVVQHYRHNLLPSRVLIDLYSENPGREVLLFLALYPTVPSQVLEDLADSCRDPEIQAAAATNPRCTHLLLIRMAREGGAPVRAALAANKLQSGKITAELLNDPSVIVRAALAANGAIGNTYRTVLATDPAPAVRAALAASPKLPVDLVHALSADRSPVVRATLYAFGKVEENLLLDWARSDDLEAQRLLLARKNLDPRIIQALALSPDPVVRQTAAPLHKPATHEWLAKAESDETEQRLDAAGHAGLPVEIQHLLAADPQAEVRAALAANPAIDEEVALLMAASNDLSTCIALAANPNIPGSVKIELCHHDAQAVRLQMAYRADLDDTLLAVLVNNPPDLELIGHLARRGIRFAGTEPAAIDLLLAHKRPALRRFAAHAAGLATAQLRRLLRDDAAEVRLALCENPSLALPALEALTQDWNPAVAAKARAALADRPKETAGNTDFTVLNEPRGEGGLAARIVKFFTE